MIAKELIPDSGGAGKYRGSPGQRLVISKLPSHSSPLNIYFHPNRLTFPARGIFGGKDGTKTNVYFNGDALSDSPSEMKQGYVTIETAEDHLEVECPSGAGAYDPKDRDTAAVHRDLRDGLETPEKAAREYGVNS